MRVKLHYYAGDPSKRRTLSMGFVNVCKSVKNHGPKLGGDPVTSIRYADGKNLYARTIEDVIDTMAMTLYQEDPKDGVKYEFWLNDGEREFQFEGYYKCEGSPSFEVTSKEVSYNE